MRHLVIPDTQAKPGVPDDHLEWAARYALDKEPEVIIHLGDHWDFPSLSSYETSSTKVANGRDILADIRAGNEALRRFDDVIRQENRRRNHRRRYKPKRILLRGNHDGETNGGRVERALEAEPWLAGFFEAHPMESPGWDVVPFLQPVILHGIKYSHFYVRGANGKVTQSRRGMPSAKAQVVREAMSATAGHAQGLDYHQQPCGHTIHHGLIAGSFYCLAPHHSVLTADLRYVPLGDVSVGDRLVSFDEHAPGGRGRKRRYRTGVVEKVTHDRAPVFDVTLSDGKTFTVTGNHRWLSRTGSAVRWRTTDSLQVRKANRNGTRIPKLLEEWSLDTSFSSGWLSGIYDGEGSWYQRRTTGGWCSQLSVSQVPGLVLDEILACLSGLEFKTSVDDRATIGPGAARSVRVAGGASERARLLGTIRPIRLLDKFAPEHLGSVNVCGAGDAEVVAVEPAGTQDIVRIQVDRQTMVVEGYGHHNCHEEGYLTPQGNAHWRGIVLKNDVRDGHYDLCTVSLEYLRRKYS